ncbi:MAG TPA: phosphopentomutase [Stellaceae bacterium]|nr:phosphopentomutase [Stellaceae bacterium]
MARAFILVMDSFGIGASRDAADYGDAGADTLGHIAEHCAGGRVPGRGALCVPNLALLGLAAAAGDSAGTWPQGLPAPTPIGAWGHAAETSRGKDTPSGHWEMAGVPVAFDWGYFPRTAPCFPAALTQALIERAGLTGLLGNRHASGTVIIDELGPEHLASGQPIAYTSADSVFQIAGHEEAFGLERLYAVCRIARELVEPYRIGRVIARPFVGVPGAFRRTARRRDLAVPPPAATLLDGFQAEGGSVVSIGKIGDIFAHRGTGREIKADGNEAVFDATLAAIRSAEARLLVLANFVDFDTLYGHRRDVAGYAAALEDFDARLPQLLAALRPGDVAVITADHGCDPTWPGSDHTREHVPVLAFGPGVAPRPLGRRETFADIGQSVARHLGLKPLAHGTACF